MIRRQQSVSVRHSGFLLVAILALGSLASAEWKEKVLYSFQGGTDGATPVGGVVFDSQGNLYGATQYGGATNCSPMAACGTAYQISPQTDGSWTETVLYVFKGKAYNDGEYPEGGLIEDSTGNLYGTTAYGGTGDCVLLGIKGGCGTVYELSPPTQQGGAWTETVLYSFEGGNDGYVPWGDLVFDKSGNLYGSTIFGGGKGTTCDPYYQYCGTVFKLSPPKKQGGAWVEKVLHSFAGVARGQQSGDGANPNGGLVLDSKGAVYGTTYYGGNNQKGTCEGGSWGTGCGTVFKLIPPTRKGGMWMEKQLHVFTGGKDSALPSAGVTFDSNGNLFGTTVGTLFRLAPPSKKSGSWKEAILYTFNGNALDPVGGLAFGKNGNLYGTTYSSHTFSGTVFRLKPPSRKGGSWTFDILYGFTGPPDGAQPAATLISDKRGNLYSTTQKGGTGPCYPAGCGVVFDTTP